MIKARLRYFIKFDICLHRPLKAAYIGAKPCHLKAATVGSTTTGPLKIAFYQPSMVRPYENHSRRNAPPKTTCYPDLVRLHTDEGVTGLGETWFGAAAIEADIHDRIVPALLGQDPSRIEYLHRKMRPMLGFKAPAPKFVRYRPLMLRFGISQANVPINHCMTCWAARPARAYNSPICNFIV
jgi:hypothetical protein